MDQLTDEQLVGVQSVCQDLVSVRAKLERLDLPEPIASQMWSEISNAAAKGSLFAYDARVKHDARLKREAAG